MKLKNYAWQIIGVMAVLSVGASIVYSNSVSNKANDGVTFEPHVKGSADAKVTIIEYSDFQCPACAQFYPIVKDALDQFDGDLQVEFKHFPLISIHPLAIPAAKAAEAAGQQGEFFAMHDALFENTQEWTSTSNPQPFFNAYAEEIGLDMALFKKHMKSSLINDKINDEFNEARSLGLNSTPTFFLNGERMQFTTFEEFINQITSAISLVDGGDNETEESIPVSHTNSEPEVRFGF